MTQGSPYTKADEDAIRAELAERFKAAIAKNSRPKLLTPLPWRVRPRLAFHHRVDVIGCWLCGHRHPTLAMRLWQACGMWQSRRGWW